MYFKSCLKFSIYVKKVSWTFFLNLWMNERSKYSNALPFSKTPNNIVFDTIHWTSTPIVRMYDYRSSVCIFLILLKIIYVKKFDSINKTCMSFALKKFSVLFQSFTWLSFSKTRLIILQLPYRKQRLSVTKFTPDNWTHIS